ncbi:MAG: response regulator [Ruminococcus sp.]|nr:response regulator [Ruminococcus sp.]
MRILAVDDEPIALKGLMSAISEVVPNAEVNGFGNISDALLYAYVNHPQVAFLDVNFRAESGLDLAKRLKEMNPKINIIFTTGHKHYMEEAFKIHVSGYIVKPVTPEKIKGELSNLRTPVDDYSEKKMCVRTFGDFEVFVNNKPLQFSYLKTKEIFAYLIDCKGSMCTNGTLICILWGDDDPSAHRSYLSNLLADLSKTLKDAGCENVLIKRRGQIGIDTTKIDCDYYRWLKGEPQARAEFAGKYMFRYSWAEVTLASMMQEDSF